MKKRLVLIVLAVLCVVMLAACGECDHDWEKATCEEPKTCSECGETKGKAKGHDWVDATCEEPKTCSECGETEGEPAEHVWTDATCEDPSYCENCYHPNTDALGHDWVDATYDDPKTCARCGKTEGEPLPKPTAAGDLGITLEEYAPAMNAVMLGDGYSLTYVTDTDEGTPAYGVFTTDGEFTDVVVTFESDVEGGNITGVMVITFELDDPEKVGLVSYVGIISWMLVDPDVSSEMVTEMLAEEPIVADDGTTGHRREQNGRGYYIITTSDRFMFIVKGMPS